MSSIECWPVYIKDDMSALGEDSLTWYHHLTVIHEHVLVDSYNGLILADISYEYGQGMCRFH